MRRSASIRPLFALLTVVLFCGFSWVGAERSAYGAGASRSTLYSELEAESIGLTRAWFQQVTMDINRDSITHVTLQDNTLFITTDAARLHAIDGNTGVTLWSRIVGEMGEETLPAAANSKVVAVVHGTEIHVFDRFNGKRLLVIPFYEPPGGGLQLSERYIYLPTLNKKIYAYPLQKLNPADPTLKMSYEQVEAYKNNPTVSKEISEKIALLLKDDRVEQYQLEPIDPNTVQACPAIGHPLVQPVLCSQMLNSEAFSWVTDINSLMIAHLNFSKTKNALKLHYRVSLAPELLYIDPLHLGKVDVEYLNEMNWRPTFVPKDISQANLQKGDKAKGGLILLGAGSGFVFAVNDLSGDVQWKFPAGISVADPIGACGGNCFVPTFNGTFYCVDMKNGQQKWMIPRILQYVTSGKTKLYVINMLNRLVVLNLADGRPIDSLPLDVDAQVVFNVESDRIFIVAPDGLVQCLHEIDSPEPVYYRETSAAIADRLQTLREEIQFGKKQEDKTKKKEEKSADIPAEPAPEPDVKVEDNPFAEEEPAATDEKPADEPAATDEKPADEPAATDEKPADEPAAVDEKPADEPAAADEKPADEPAAADEKPAEGDNPFE